MLDEKEINEAIAELENRRNHTSSDCAWLANLYSIRDHAFGDRDNYQLAYSRASAPISVSTPLSTYGDSDFLLVVSGKIPEDAWAVMDDLMDTLSVTYPRVYDNVMRKLRNL